jgi:transcriptional regulator with XRE-family HTH domain
MTNGHLDEFEARARAARKVIGQKMATERRRAGYSLEQAAHVFRWPAVRLQQIENGEIDVDYADACVLATFYGVSVNAFSAGPPGDVPDRPRED